MFAVWNLEDILVTVLQFEKPPLNQLHQLDWLIKESPNYIFMFFIRN